MNLVPGAIHHRLCAGIILFDPHGHTKINIFTPSLWVRRLITSQPRSLDFSIQFQSFWLLSSCLPSALPGLTAFSSSSSNFTALFLYCSFDLVLWLITPCPKSEARLWALGECDSQRGHLWRPNVLSPSVCLLHGGSLHHLFFQQILYLRRAYYAPGTVLDSWDTFAIQ